MGKIANTFNVSNVNSLDDLRRFSSILDADIINQINGNLSFQDNLRTAGSYVVTFKSAMDIQTVSHNLNMVPQGVIEIYRTAAIITYAPQGNAYTWTSNQIFLQSNGAGSVTIYLI